VPRDRRSPTSPLAGKLAAALEAPDAPRPGDHILVAVSGGPDSTALLAALADVAAERRLRLTAATIDHGLRGAESVAECARVAALARDLGTGFETRAVPIVPGPGFETRARTVRYRALGAIATGVGATSIAVGHTRDDQVETVLMRLLRGAGRRGLGGMRRRRGRLWRPLLAVTRADVRRYLAEAGLGFAVDRSNADLRHTRNRLRRLLVPLLEAEFNPSLGPALAALAERLGDEDDLLATIAAGRATALRSGDALGTAVAAEPPALARRIIQRWLVEQGGRAVGAIHVARVLALAAGATRGTVAVPGPARVVREGESLIRRPGRDAPATTPIAMPIQVGTCVVAGRWRVTLSTPRPRQPDEHRPADARTALLDADALPEAMHIRTPVPGDRMKVLGVGTRRLKSILIDAKVPRESRPTTPLLVSGNDIIWIPGIARSPTATIGPSTKRIVEASAEPNG
jgi:tRNA(Ile)-lysidine synthase